MSDLHELYKTAINSGPKPLLPATQSLGPNQLQWLRDHIPQFKRCNESVLAVRAMVEANRRETETAHD